MLSQKAAIVKGARAVKATARAHNYADMNLYMIIRCGAPRQGLFSLRFLRESVLR